MSDAKTAEQAPIEQTPQPIPEVVQKQYDHLVETIRAYNPGADFAQIDAAFRYAAAHHGAQKRKEAETELRRIEGELRQKLLETRKIQ